MINKIYLKSVVFNLGLLLLPFNAFAALPPLYSSLNEYKALLPHLEGRLNSADYIQNIQHNPEGFEVTTTQHILHVDIII